MSWKVVLVCSCASCCLSWVSRSQSCVLPVSGGHLGRLRGHDEKQAKGYYWKVVGSFFFSHKVISRQCFCFHHELQVSCCEITDIIVLHLQVFRFKFNSSASLLSYYAHFRQQIVSPLASARSEMGQTSCTPNSFSSVAYFSPNWSQSLFLTDKVTATSFLKKNDVNTWLGWC